MKAQPSASSARLRGLTYWVRLLLTVTCTSLCAVQSWTLLRLHWSEPVAVSIGFTPWEDVHVPGITLCPLPYQWRQHTLFSTTNITVAETIWMANGLSTGALLSRCEPGCGTHDTVSYPGGHAATRIGAWRSWIALEVGAVCHTLTPNVSWGQLVDMSPSKKTQLLLRLNLKKLKAQGIHIYVHSRRRPVVASFGIRGLQRDANFEQPGEKLVHLEVTSNVINRENLARATCNPDIEYHFQTCFIRCTHAYWAKQKNCSTPDMMEDFPHLGPCSKGDLLHMERTHALSKLATKCSCLPPCREHRFTASITNTKDLSDEVHDPYSEFLVSPSAIPEMVSVERLAYGLPSLLSELGGFISLMLGVSVLTLLEVFTGLLKKAEGGILGTVGGQAITREDTAEKGGVGADQRLESVQGNGSCLESGQENGSRLDLGQENGSHMTSSIVESGRTRMVFTITSGPNKSQ